MGMSFEQEPNFAYLRQLVVSAATDANLDIFDNVFDWSLKMVRQEFKSDPGVARSLLQIAQAKKLASESAMKREKKDMGSESKKNLDPLMSQRAKQFRFHTFEDVKMIIYKAYSKRMAEKRKEKELQA